MDGSVRGGEGKLSRVSSKERVAVSDSALGLSAPELVNNFCRN